MSTNNLVQFHQNLNANVHDLHVEVCQAELAHVLELRRQCDAIDERLKEAEQAIRSALEAGASVQPGILSARLKVTERRNVAWKVVCERELGEDYCRRVLAATRPDSYTTLSIGAQPSKRRQHVGVYPQLSAIARGYGEENGVALQFGEEGMKKKSDRKSIKIVAKQKNESRELPDVIVRHDWDYRYGRYFAAIDSGIEVLSALAETAPDQDDDTLKNTTVSICFALRPMLEEIKSLRLDELPLLNVNHPHYEEIRSAMCKTAHEVNRAKSASQAA